MKQGTPRNEGGEGSIRKATCKFDVKIAPTHAQNELYFLLKMGSCLELKI